MAQTKSVCTACSCLCDDIEIHSEGDIITRIENACLKGASLFIASGKPERRARCMIDRREVGVEEAVNRASQLLRQAKNPLIFGLDNSTLEAQEEGIKLARSLGATIDDCSSFCQGVMVESILSGHMSSCSLAEVNDADLLIYWGANPYHSHPRHLSKFSYYSHDKYHEAGWRPDVMLTCIEVRDTETTSLCRPAFKIAPGGDADFIRDVLTVLKDQSGREDAKTLVELIQKSRFCVIFAGLGLTYALDGEISLFCEMVQQVTSGGTRVAVIPMVGHFNMRGFNHSLYNETGFVNKVSFADGTSHHHEFSLLEQLRNHAVDCVLIAGADPLSSLPHSLVKNLETVPIISMDPFSTPTTMASQVVFGVAVSGPETGGKALRMDGEEIFLGQGRETERPSDKEILTLLLNEVER